MQASLIPHIIRKDLHHVRILFGIWLLLLLAQGALIGSGFTTGPGNYAWQIAYTGLALGIPMLQALVIIILLPILIHDEPLVGDSAFWFTRPIGRSTLLTAKATFVAALLILPPLAVETVVFIANSITPADIMRALPEVFYGSLALIVPLAALASLTKSFAKFALWLVLFFIVSVVIVFVVQMIRMLFSPDLLANEMQNYTLATSRGLASGFFYIGGGLFVTIWQYLTRRTPVSVLVFSAAVGLGILAQLFWPINFFQPPEKPASAATFPKSSVIPSLQGDISTSQTARLSTATEPETVIRGRIAFADVPPGYQVTNITTSEAALALDDGIKITSERNAEYESLEWWPSALSAAIGGIPVLNGGTSNDRYGQIFSMKTELFRKWKSSPGTLSASLFFKIEKISEIGRLPLRPGAKFRVGSRNIEIADVLRDSDGCRLIIRERTINLWAERKFTAKAFSGYRGGYLLVNQRRNEAIVPDVELNVDATAALIQSSMRLVNRNFPLRFTGARGSERKVTVNEEWLADAELVVLEAANAGSLQRELTVKDFLLSPKQ